MDAELAYLFRHGLLRDAAYELHLPRERGRLHALVVELIESVYAAEELVELFAAELSDHCRRARLALADNSLLAREREYTLAAAKQASANFRKSDAVDGYRHMVSICEDEQKPRCLCELAVMLGQTSNLQEAEECCRRALELSPGPSDDATFARRLLGDFLYQLGRPADALNVLRAAYRDSRTRGDLRGRYEIGSTQASVLRFLGRMESAARLFRACIAYFESAGDLKVACRTKNSLGALMFSTGQYAAAEKLLREVLEAHAENDLITRRQSLATLANVYEELNRIPEAEQAYLEALELSRRTGSRAHEGNQLGNLAILLHNDGRLDDAEPLYYEAFALHREVGLPHSQAVSLSNIAGLYRDRGDLATADKLFHESLEIALSVGSPRITGVIEGNLAGVVRERGRFEEAREHYERALACHAEASNRYFQATHGCDWAILELQAGEMERAQELWGKHASELRELQATRELEWRISDMREYCDQRDIEPLE